MKSFSMLPNASSSLNGIITYFNEVYKDDFKRYVTIHPSSTVTIEGRNGAESLINRTMNSTLTIHDWCSKGQGDDNFILKFHKHRINPKYYTFQARHAYDHFPYSWFVSGSNDMISWKQIGSENQTRVLLERGKVQTFPLNNVNSYKYIKFTQTEGLMSGSLVKRFCLRSVELFGDLLNGNIHSRCVCRSTFNSIFFMMLLLVK